jgi:hypothetical protein
VNNKRNIKIFVKISISTLNNKNKNNFAYKTFKRENYSEKENLEKYS